MEHPTGKPVVAAFNRLRQGFGGLSAPWRIHQVTSTEAPSCAFNHG
jgi:hypothetical protein